ncbi:DUF1642 domain-containing protein [Enterococcus sp. BWM-S5]|uniref:DUF1642 domain-containing protein n=1 Tax=Enterococcus larvae TaxID=2794352 RepID=A0ABS4CJX6_9ENTE|nr:DUF1642 domain-containing protein [Enterococcus larvae]MBP1046421.1 DUF1642 domain-containing protein [Enterococcus larvae]
MSKVEEKISLLEGLIPRGVISPKLKSDLIDYLREIEVEQEELQNKAEKYDNLLALAVVTNTTMDEVESAVRTFTSKRLKPSLWEALQEASKPVEVPVFIAKWIEDHKKKGLIFDVSVSSMTTGDVDEWYLDNEDIYAKAWYFGYTVKQEQLYYVFDKLTGFYLVEKLTLAHDPYTTFKWTDDEQAREAYTEQQIKKHMGDNYMKFAVKVEEEQ